MNIKNDNRKRVEELQKNALLFYQNGKMAEAKKVCKRILQISPVNVVALEIIGVNCLVETRFDDAVAIYAKLIAVNPNASKAYINHGIALKALGKFELAIQSFDNAISLNQKDAKAYYNRANTLIALKKFDNAVSDYKRAIMLDPSFWNAYLNLGSALFEDKQYSEALQNLEKAVLLNPKNDSAHYNKGKALHKIGKYGAALESFDKALSLNPNSSEAHLERGGVLRDLKRLEESLASYENSIALNPHYAETHNYRGIVLHQLKRFDEAIASYEKAIALKPQFIKAKSNLAKLPRGEIPDDLVLSLLHQWNYPSDKALQAISLFMKADLLKHAGRFEESFEVLLSANLLRQKEFEGKLEDWREGNCRILKEIRNWKALVRKVADTNGPKLLLIMGPSRSGKTTIEFFIPNNRTTKRGLEGRSAPLAIEDLQGLWLRFNQHDEESRSDVARQVIDSLFYPQNDLNCETTHELVTNTNPLLIRGAHLIFDLYPCSYFVFVYRDPIDNAADIFANDYTEPQKFAYHARTALEYVNWYHAASDQLAEKMGSRALKVNYADFIKNAELSVKSIARLVGVDFEVDTSQFDISGRSETSVYRRLFLKHLKED